jgi:hypothetical protein
MFSALPLRTDNAQCGQHVRKVPRTDIHAMVWLCSRLKNQASSREELRRHRRARLRKGSPVQWGLFAMVRSARLARSARSNEIAASEVPAPVLGHPAVGGAVARYVADAWERQVIPEQQDTVGCRLIEQSPS